MSIVFRIVRGDRGRVRMRMEFVLRFGYGQTVPWVRRTDFGLRAVAGPDALELHTRVELKSEDYRTIAEFSVGEGAQRPLRALLASLASQPRARHRSRSAAGGDGAMVARMVGALPARRPSTPHPWREAVVRSLVTLKALTYRPTGGIVAAATTSLPEELGGERNWDYRFCWIRDATLTLYALLSSGYRDEANAWRRMDAARRRRPPVAAADHVRPRRRAAAARRSSFPGSAGYEDSKPVRIGNAAYDQLQLDVYGELMDALHVGAKIPARAVARRLELPESRC